MTLSCLVFKVHLKSGKEKKRVYSKIKMKYERFLALGNGAMVLDKLGEHSYCLSTCRLSTKSLFWEPSNQHAIQFFSMMLLTKWIITGDCIFRTKTQLSEGFSLASEKLSCIERRHPPSVKAVELPLWQKVALWTTEVQRSQRCNCFCTIVSHLTSPQGRHHIVLSSLAPGNSKHASRICWVTTTFLCFELPNTFCLLRAQVFFLGLCPCSVFLVELWFA